MKIPISLIPNLVSSGLEIWLKHLELKLKAEGRTEITAEDLEAYRLEDPQAVIDKYIEERSSGDDSG